MNITTKSTLNRLGALDSDSSYSRWVMTHYDPVPAITTRENYGSGKNSDHQRHGLNGQFWSTKRQGQGSTISCLFFVLRRPTFPLHHGIMMMVSLKEYWRWLRWKFKVTKMWHSFILTDVMLLNTGHWTGFVSESINHPTSIATNRPVDGPRYCILECRTSRCWLVPLGYLQNIPPRPGSLRVIPHSGAGDFLRAQGYQCSMGIIWRQYHTIWALHSDLATLHCGRKWHISHLVVEDYFDQVNGKDHWNKGRRSLLMSRLSGQPRLPVELVSQGPGESGVTNCGFYLSSFSSDGADPVHQIRLTTTNLAWPGFALIKIGSQGIYNYFAFLVALCKYLWLWEDSSEYKLDLILVHKNILLELKLTWSIRLEINCFQPSSYSIILSQIPEKNSNWKPGRGWHHKVFMREGWLTWKSKSLKYFGSKD